MPKLLLAVITIAIVLLAAVFLFVRSRSAGSNTAASMHAMAASVVKQPKLGDRNSDTGRLVARPDTSPASSMSLEDFENFKMFRAGMGAFSSREAKELGLTEDQQSAIALIVWEARKKLNAAFAEHTTVSRTADGQTVLAFHLEKATADSLRRETIDSIRDTVGQELWPRVEQSWSMLGIDADLDSFGEFPTAYSIKQRSDSKDLDVAIYREDRPDVIRGCHHRLMLFKAIYGPLAAKAGF